MTNVCFLHAKVVGGLFAMALLLCPALARAGDPGDSARSERQVLVRGAPIHGANGLRFDKRDRLYVASVLGREIVVIDPQTGTILNRIGLPEIDMGTPDDLAFGPDGSLYWTSLLSGEVGRLSPAGVKTSQLISPGVNSIAFSNDGRLFVGQCVLGSLLYELDPNLTQPPRVITDKLGPGCAMNGADWHDGFLYGARYFTGEIVRVNVDSGEFTTVAQGFGTPEAVKFDSHGRMYVVDALNGEVVRVNIQTGEKTVIAQLSVGLDNLVLDSQDHLYVSSYMHGFIVQVLSGGRTRTVSVGGMVRPGGVAVLPGPEGRETVFVADLFSLKAFDGRSGKPEGTTASIVEVSAFKLPFSVSRDGDHWSSPHRLILSSYFDNSVQVWDPEAQQILEEYFDFVVPMNAIRFRGDLVVAELGTGSVVRRDAGTGEHVTLAKGLAVPTGLAATDRNLWAADWATGTVWKIVANGAVLATPVAVATGLLGPEGLAVDRDSLLVVESRAGRVSRIDLSTGQVSTVAKGLAIDGAPAPVGLPPSWIFHGVAVDSAGAVYVTGDLTDVLYRFWPENQDRDK
ncbi:MAG TPA: SMP-30/gluconolactonase/LRE family protein [Burkholderiales bacterium]|nr:SMP-30/gluconolactonase/LRE family protein [Burkholderiales bacterium]